MSLSAGGPSGSRRRNKDAELQDGVKLVFRHGFGVHGPIRDNVDFIEAEQDSGQIKEGKCNNRNPRSLLLLLLLLCCCCCAALCFAFFFAPLGSSLALCPPSTNCVTGNCLSLNPAAVIFPIGQLMCLYWADDGEMSFFSGTSSNVRAILAFSKAPNNRLVGVCEQCGPNDGAQCSVFLLKSRKRIKTVIYPSKADFTNCCFSGDSKSLVTISSAPDKNLIVWDWMSQKVKHCIPLGQSTITRVSSPPSSASGGGSLQLTTTGPSHLRVWNIEGDAPTKPNPIYKEHENFVDHSWLTPESGIQRLAVVTQGGTADVTSRQRLGSILLFQTVEEPPYIEYRRTMTVLLRGSTRIETIAKSSRGFVLGGSSGFFSVYEKTDDRKDPYMHIKTFYCCREIFSSISCNHNDEQAVAFSKSSKLLSFPLGSVDMIEETEAENSFVSVIPGGTHEGSIIDSSICALKPLVATVGSDRTVRLWNYLRWHCELSQEFTVNDDPTCISLHPSGTQVVVGLRERIRMYNVMIDELKLFRELPIKGCRGLEFSNGGNMFAACVGITITVFGNYQFSAQTGFQQLYSFSGHISPVKKVVWSPDDNVLYSAGMDGNVYGWDLVKNSRCDDTSMLNRSSSYTGMVVQFADRENKTNRVAVCGTEGYFLELAWTDGVKDSHVLKQIEIGKDERDSITCLALSNSKKYLFAGTAGGNIKTYDWPLENGRPLCKAYSAHQFKKVTGPGGSESYRGITTMNVSHDDNYLFTTAEDGTVFVVGLQIVERGLDTKPSLDPDIRQFQNDAVFVLMDEVEQRNEEFIDLQKKVADLKSENEYELHNKDTMWAKEFKEMTEERESILVAERNRYSDLQDQFDKYKREEREKFEHEQSNHVQITQELENQFEHKLAVEMERFDRLAEEIEAMQQKCEGLLEAQAAQHERQIRAIEQQKLKQEKQLNMMVHRMKEDAEHNEKMYKEVLDQQEDEYEKELQKLMSVADVDLKTEQDSTRKMQAIVQTLNTKRAQLKKKNEELKVKSTQHEIEYGKEKARRVKLEDTLSHIQLHLKEREDALSEKEKTILGLRSTNRTLDNFRYVLDHRLQQLMKERGPISKHIEGLERHVRSMYDELVVEFQKKKDNNRLLDQKELKIKTQEKEIASIRSTSREKERELAAIKRDLTAMVGVTQAKELEEIVKNAYRKFVRGETDKVRRHGCYFCYFCKGSQVQVLFLKREEGPIEYF